MGKLSTTQCLEKWMKMPGKLSVASIPDPQLRENLAVLLENQSNEGGVTSLFETDTNTGDYGSNAGDGARFQPIALALVRRSYYEHFATKVVGMQAMTGPVGLAYALRKVYDIPGVPGSSTYNGGSDSYEAAFRAINNFAGYSGAGAGTSSSAATSAFYDPTNGTYFGQFGAGASTSAAELWQIGTTMPTLRLFLDKTPITAMTRRLAASFSLEAAQDLKAMHNLDIEREMLEILSVEMPAERDREILGRMMQTSIDVTKGGEAPTQFTVSASSGRWSQEYFSNLANVIVKKANDIATATFRGAGNFVIVSPRVATALQAAGPQFTAITSEVNASTTVTEVGKINGTITVYRDALAPSDYALVGYKGPTINDAGIILSDFITGLYNRAVRPTDFGSNIGLLSRYAITDTLLGSGRYYRFINVVGLQNILGA